MRADKQNDIELIVNPNSYDTITTTEWVYTFKSKVEHESDILIWITQKDTEINAKKIIKWEILSTSFTSKLNQDASR